MNYFGHSPVIKTPLTDFGARIAPTDIQKYGSEQCKKFERRYTDCLEVYGVEKSYIKCKDIFSDFDECRNGYRHTWRYEQLIAERDKQYKEGKLEKKYSESPNPEVVYKLDL